MKIRLRMAQVIASIFILAMSITTVSAQGSASPVLQRIAESKTLRVGMTSEQPPFNVTNRDGKIIGMDVDLAGLLAASMEVKLEIVEMPFAELIPALEEGKVDLVLSGMTSTLQRNLRVPFVGPYYISGKSLLTKSDTIAKIQSAEEMNNERLTIAALGGSTSELFVKNTLPNPKLTLTKSLEEAIRLLRNALSRFDDGEIAAHLGEVLWVSGRQLEAEEVWKKALKKSPDNSMLQDVMGRFID